MSNSTDLVSLILSYEKVVGRGWFYAQTDLIRAALGRKHINHSTDGRDSQVGESMQRTIKFLFRVFEQAITDYKAGLEVFDQNGWLIGLDRAKIMKGAKLASKRTWTEMIRKRRLGQFIETRDGWFTPYKIRIRWDRVFSLLQGFYEAAQGVSKGVAQCVVQPTPLLPVQSDSGSAPLALAPGCTKEKTKTPQGELASFLRKKKVTSQSSMSPEAQALFKKITPALRHGQGDLVARGMLMALIVAIACCPACRTSQVTSDPVVSPAAQFRGESTPEQ